MENEDKIEIIKDILYEESTRSMLLGQSDTLDNNVNQPSSIWKWVAAACVIAFATFIGYGLLNDNSHDRALLANRYHEFPIISKSRGAEQNIVDDYLAQINSKEFDVVLPLLEGSDLSEKDQFVKALMLFEMEKFEDAKKVINAINWSDPYHIQEVNWLHFLINYIQNESLDGMVDKLSAEYKLKAEKLLRE